MLVTSKVDRDLRDPGETVAEQCSVCGLELDGDPDEDPIGAAGEPMCGNCVREREEFALDSADGELDGEYG